MGTAFARALAAKDKDRLLGLMQPDIQFKAMTPRRTWEADDRDQVISVLLDNWFEDSDEIDSIERIDTDAFADRRRVGYRFNINNSDGRFVVEQQAYLSERDGQIDWMRVVCSGFRPLGD